MLPITKIISIPVCVIIAAQLRAYQNGRVVMESVEQELLALETARCQALVAGDAAAVLALADRRLVHVHTSGRVEDYYSYASFLASGVRFHSVHRDDLRVTLAGDAAVMTGLQTMALSRHADGPRMDIRCHVMQVWARADAGWKLLAFQATLAPAPA